MKNSTKIIFEPFQKRAKRIFKSVKSRKRNYPLLLQDVKLVRKLNGKLPLVSKVDKIKKLIATKKNLAYISSIDFSSRYELRKQKFELEEVMTKNNKKFHFDIDVFIVSKGGGLDKIKFRALLEEMKKTK
eukprot:gene8086-12547_t